MGFLLNHILLVWRQYVSLFSSKLNANFYCSKLTHFYCTGKLFKISGNFYIRFCRQYMPLFASIATIVSLLLTSDRNVSHWSVAGHFWHYWNHLIWIFTLNSSRMKLTIVAVALVVLLALTEAVQDSESKWILFGPRWLSGNILARCGSFMWPHVPGFGLRPTPG